MSFTFKVCWHQIAFRWNMLVTHFPNKQPFKTPWISQRRSSELRSGGELVQPSNTPSASWTSSWRTFLSCAEGHQWSFPFLHISSISSQSNKCFCLISSSTCSSSSSNNNNNNSNNSNNNNNNKEQTITAAPSFFFVSTFFYKQKLWPLVLFCPPPWNNQSAIPFLCFFLIVQTKTGAPSVVLTPPLLQQPFYKQRLGCCSDHPPLQQHFILQKQLTRWCWIEDHSQDDVE